MSPVGLMGLTDIKVPHLNALQVDSLLSSWIEVVQIVASINYGLFVDAEHMTYFVHVVHV